MISKKLEALSGNRTLASFRYRNYRIWFIGQLVSLLGTWMQVTAQAFLIYELTHSEAYLGLVGFFAGIPAWVLTMPAGVICDRMHRRTVLLLTQIGMMALALVLAILTFTGLVQPWHILVLAFLLGVANAFDAPARQAFVLDLVDREHLANAVSLNSTMFNISMMLGPAFAGITYALMGPGWCFMLNAISFIAIIIGLLLMRFEPWKPVPRSSSFQEEMKEGFHYVLKHKILFALFCQMAAMTLFATSFVTLTPSWAVSILHGNAGTNGLLLSARGAGALVLTLWLASRVTMPGRGRILNVMNLVVPLFLILFALLHWVAASLILIFILGALGMVVANLTNVLVQLNTEDKLRGRVQAFYSLIFFGIMPIGSLWIGAAAGRWGPVNAIILGSVLALASALIVQRAFPSLSRIE